MFSEYINYGYSYESALPVDRLVVQLTDKAQVRKCLSKSLICVLQIAIASAKLLLCVRARAIIVC